MEISLAKHGGEYKSKKRRKELSRQKKQEEKRKRRFDKKIDVQQDVEITESEEA
jgi:hypothetical protein